MNNELLFQRLWLWKILKAWVPMAFGTAILVIIAGFIFKYDEIDFKNHSVSSTAEVIGLTEYGYPVLSYVVDSKEFKVRSRSQIPNASVGSKVEVKYHSEKPDYVQIDENPVYQIAMPMIVFGSLGALATGYFLFRRIIRVRRRRT